MPLSRNVDRKIRIVIIDEEVVVRQLILKVIREDPQIEIVGTFSNISKVADTLSNLEPDVILLDITGKKVNGMDTLEKIHSVFPLLPIIVLSERTELGANKALDALERGAIDFVTKPEKSRIIVFADRHFRKRILPVIKSSVKLHEIMWDNLHKKVKLPQKISDEEIDIMTNRRVDLVTIGGCTGGPSALFSLIPQLPDDFPIPIVIAQHMPKFYTNVFAERLNKLSNLVVQEAYNGAKLEAGHVWIAPGGYHIVIKRRGIDKVIGLHKGPRENTCRPSIDVLFQSASEVYGVNLLGILLSGRGRDGVKGSKYIRSRGGQLLVQDSTSSLIWELPEAIVRLNLAHKVLPIDKLADELMSLVYANRELTFEIVKDRRHKYIDMDNRKSETIQY
ncbi:MAG TPA: chemotaxis-specific protein-glutamate methyltransferase CheB [Balneolales bacterium]|nr:chemotaxis-specific protein-glutamate methyltransferase CheB [Balneolales bacterium]